MKLMERLVERLYSIGSIKVKVMGIVLGLALVLSAPVIYQAKVSMEAQARDQLQRQAVSLAHFIASRGTDMVLINNLYGVRELLTDTMAHNPDLRYIVIYSPDGRVIDSTFGRDFPVALLNVRPSGDHQHPTTLDGGEERIYDIAVPMFDGRAGTARVGVTDSRLMAATRSTVRTMLLETAATTAGALLVAYLLTVALTRPLEDLVAATRAVGAGDLSRRPRVFGSDETGQLSASFNTMLDHLQASRAELLQRNRDLTILNRVARTVSRPVNENELLSEVTADVQEALTVERVCIFRVDRERAEWVCAHERAQAPCLASMETLRAAADAQESRLVSKGAVVPLVAEGRTVGVMCLHGSGTALVSAMDSGLLTALGRQLGIALENIRLWEELQAKEVIRADLVNQLISAQEAERKRIALELHDHTGQLMTSMMVGLKLLEGSQTPEQAQERIDDLRTIASTVLEEVHSLALELRPPVLDDLGLLHALYRYTRDFSRKHGIRVDLEADGFTDRQLPAYVGTTLYRVTQEALTNVARHSGAQQVSVTLSWHRSKVTGIIHDDGRGFDIKEVQGRQRERLGLFSMQERAKMAGGRLELRSAPGSGTTVLIQVPVPEAAMEREAGA